MTSDEIRGKIQYYEQLIAGYIEEKVQREKELEELDLHWKGNDNAVGKTVAWIHYMTNWNRTYGNFAAGKNESFMVLNRIYNVDDTGELENATTYINPKDYTYIFAENDIDNMDFWVQIGCGIEARRVMSAKQIPLM